MRVGAKDAMITSLKERIWINVYACTQKNRLSWKLEEADVSVQLFTQQCTLANYAQK